MRPPDREPVRADADVCIAVADEDLRFIAGLTDAARCRRAEQSRRSFDDSASVAAGQNRRIAAPSRATCARQMRDHRRLPRPAHGQPADAHDRRFKRRAAPQTRLMLHPMPRAPEPRERRQHQTRAKRARRIGHALRISAPDFRQRCGPRHRVRDSATSRARSPNGPAPWILQATATRREPSAAGVFDPLQRAGTVKLIRDRPRNFPCAGPR